MFADQFEALTHWFHNFERTTVTVLVLLALSWLLWRYRGKRESHTAALRARGSEQP